MIIALISKTCANILRRSIRDLKVDLYTLRRAEGSGHSLGHRLLSPWNLRFLSAGSSRHGGDRDRSISGQGHPIDSRRRIKPIRIDGDRGDLARGD